MDNNPFKREDGYISQEQTKQMFEGTADLQAIEKDLADKAAYQEAAKTKAAAPEQPVNPTAMQALRRGDYSPLSSFEDATAFGSHLLKDFGTASFEGGKRLVGTAGNILDTATENALALNDIATEYGPAGQVVKGAEEHLGVKIPVLNDWVKKDSLKIYREAQDLVPEAIRNVLSFELDDNAPWYSEMGQFALEMGPGIVAANKVMGGAKALATYKGTVKKGLADYLKLFVGTEVGANLTGPTSMGTAITGEDAAMVSLIPGVRDLIGGASDETQSKKLFNDRIDMLVDGLAVGGVLGVAGGGIKLANQVLGGMFMNAFNLGSATARNKKVAGELFQILAEISDSDPPEVRAQKFQQLVDYIKQNQEEIISFKDVDERLPNVETVQDIFAILKQKYDPNIYGADISTLEASLKDKQLRQGRVSTLNRLRYNIRGANLDQAEDLPSQQLHNVLVAGKNISDPRAINRTSEMFIQRNLDESGIPVLQATRETAERRLLKLEEELQKKYRDNADFKFFVESLPGAPSISDRSGFLSGKKLFNHLKTTFNALDARRRELYSAIPDTPVNQRRLREEADKLLNSDLLNTEQAERLEDIISSGGSFKQLQEFLTVDENGIGLLLSSRKEPYEMQSAIAFKRFIKDQGKELNIPEFKEAETFFQREYLPWLSDETLNQTRKIIKEEKANTITNPVQQFEEVFGEKMTSTRRSDPVEATAIMKKELDRDLSSIMQNAPTPGEGTALAADYIKYKLRDRFREAIGRMGKEGINEDFITNLYQDLSSWGTAIDQFAPAWRKDLEDLVAISRDAKLSKKNFEETISSLNKDIARLEREVYDGVLRGFVDPATGRSFGTGIESIKNMMVDSKRYEHVQRMAEFARGEPLVQDALRSAYSEAAEDFLFTKNKTATGAFAININNLKAFADGNTSLNRIANDIFPGGTDTSMEDLMRETARYVWNSNAGRGVRSENYIDPTSIRTRGGVAIQSMMTWVFGILNPTAARVKTVTGHILRETDPTDSVKNFLDEMMANPEEFLKIVDELKLMDQPRLTSDHKYVLWRALSKGGALTLGTDGEEEKTPTETDFMLMESRPVKTFSIKGE